MPDALPILSILFILSETFSNVQEKNGGCSNIRKTAAGTNPL